MSTPTTDPAEVPDSDHEPIDTHEYDPDGPEPDEPQDPDWVPDDVIEGGAA